MMLFFPLLAVYTTPRKDVVFLLDGSDGNRNSFPAMRDFVQRVVEQFNIEANRDRVSVVQYSRDAEVHFYLNSYTTKEDVLDRVRGLRHKGGRPLNTGAALQYVRDNVFTASSGSRRLEGVPQILILLSGGRSFDNTPASALKQGGILVFLSVGTRNSSREVQRIANDPTYAQSINEFSDLPSVQQQFISSLNNVLGQVKPMTTTVPGKPDSRTPLEKQHTEPFVAKAVCLFTRLVCFRQKSFPVCSCQLAHACTYSKYQMPSAHVTVCSISLPVAERKRDVVFLLDGSDGTRSSFPAMRDFVERMVERLNVSENRDRVSVVQYSRDPEAHFYLNTYSGKEDILDTVRGLRHKGGRPLNTGAALQYVRDNVFTASSGSRSVEGVPQLLILLSGGRSSDNVDTPASSLKELGVLIFGIGKIFAGVEMILKKTQKARLIAKHLLCNAIWLFFLFFFSLQCPPHLSHNSYFLVEGRRQRRDVVFLLDGSDGTRNGFPAMKEFVQRMVERLDIANRDRVSVVQYSRDAEVHFYLNSYTTKEDVLDRVRGLRHKGGRPLNTGAALQYVRDNVFTASSGSRRLEGVPQILILLSGGRSFDSVDTAASSLKELGVLTYGIGSRGSDSRELQRISYAPSYALSVSDFSELPNVQEQLLASVQDVAMPVTPTSPTLTGMCMLMTPYPERTNST
uniref:VWFA domain-containing protein n=1 Tax=Cyprinus carpio carpio TaxID=630221 RepID=A0A9J8C9Y9_CYPCA